MTRNFVQFVVGSLKSGKKLAALHFGIGLPRKKRGLTSTLQTGLLCFGNSAELATFKSKVVEPASYKEK